MTMLLYTCYSVLSVGSCSLISPSRGMVRDIYRGKGSWPSPGLFVFVFMLMLMFCLMCWFVF